MNAKESAQLGIALQFPYKYAVLIGDGRQIERWDGPVDEGTIQILVETAGANVCQFRTYRDDGKMGPSAVLRPDPTDPMRGLADSFSTLAGSLSGALKASTEANARILAESVKMMSQQTESLKVVTDAYAVLASKADERTEKGIEDAVSRVEAFAELRAKLEAGTADPGLLAMVIKLATENPEQASELLGMAIEQVWSLVEKIRQRKQLTA